MFNAIKYGIVMLLSPLFGSSSIKANTLNKKSSKMIYEYKINTLENKPINLNDFKGKKILFVNVASECGYTPQYKDLEILHEKYKDKLVIIGLPCNDFGGQESGTATEIKTFCERNYGVKFIITEKVATKGSAIHPIYSWLTNPALNGWNKEAPSWNFCKYLVDEKGELIRFYKSGVSPLSDEITSLLK